MIQIRSDKRCVAYCKSILKIFSLQYCIQEFFLIASTQTVFIAWKLFDLPQIDATRCHGKEQVIIQKLLRHPKGTVSPEIEGKTYSLFRLRVSFLLSFYHGWSSLSLNFWGKSNSSSMNVIAVVVKNCSTLSHSLTKRLENRFWREFYHWMKSCKAHR